MMTQCFHHQVRECNIHDPGSIPIPTLFIAMQVQMAFHKQQRSSSSIQLYLLSTLCLLVLGLYLPSVVLSSTSFTGRKSILVFVCACSCSLMFSLIRGLTCSCIVLHCSFQFRIVKLSSPYLNVVIIIGAILFYIDVILFGIDENVASFHIADINCQVYLLCKLVIKDRLAIY